MFAIYVANRAILPAVACGARASSEARREAEEAEGEATMRVTIVVIQDIMHATARSLAEADIAVAEDGEATVREEDEAAAE